MQDTLKMLLVKAIDLYTKFMAYDFISWYMGRYVKGIRDRMNAQTVPMHYSKIIYVIKAIHITPQIPLLLLVVVSYLLRRGVIRNDLKRALQSLVFEQK